MPEHDARELAAAGAALADAAASARRWTREVAALSRRVRTDRDFLIDESLRAEHNARTLARAAARRTCVGVFGPSQAGKSYLVSRLAQGASGEGGIEEPLTAAFADERLNFIRDINPAGGKESTGLVTRFTTERRSAPGGFPVALKLLSETDLVMLLGNSYLMDFDEQNLEFSPPRDPDAVRAHLDELRDAARNPSPCAHLDELSLYRLKAYFESNFRRFGETLAQADYWSFVQEHAARLDLRDRCRLFSVLWGCIEQFSEIYELLARGLESLGFAGEAYAAMAALTPRERSIIDVDRIKLELGAAAHDGDRVNVKAAGGEAQGQAELPRAVLCALVAELRIEVANRTWPLFESTDLLDFPGARSREKYRRIDERADSEEERAGRPRELFIRGKVALLFQRYSEERELTSMLLCMGPSNQEVKDLGPLTFDWIASSHGASARERADQRNALFIVLTKSDEEFRRKEGDDDTSIAARWSARVFASMTEPLAKTENWLDRWRTDEKGVDRPFRNTLWLRNPGVEQAHLIDSVVEGERRIEKGYAVGVEAQLAADRANFLADAAASRYFEAPGDAFDALLELNDGGVRYVVERVGQVCDATVKVEQVGARLARQRAEFLAAFGRYYESDAADSEARKRAEAMRAIEGIGGALRGHGYRGFGHLLGGLSANVEGLREVYLNVVRLGDSTDAGDATGDPVEAVEPPASIFGDLEDAPGKGGGARSAPDAAGESTDLADRFARRVFSSWALSARAYAESGAGELDPALVGFVVDELIKSMHGASFEDQLAAAVRMQTSSVNAAADTLADLCASIAATKLNDHVAGLGYAGMPADARPGVPPDKPEPLRRAFEPPADFADVPPLGEKRRSVEQQYCLDWLSAIVQLALDNLGHRKGREISEAHNRALGELLDRARLGQPAG